MAETIYIPLLGEGINVWRPAPAWKVSADRYIVLRPDDYDPEDEQWEFPPGSTVIVERRENADGPFLAAVGASHPDRQTA